MLRGESAKDFPGICGNVTIDEERNARKSAVMIEIKGGKFTVYDVIEP